MSQPPYYDDSDDENLHPIRWPDELIGRKKEIEMIDRALKARPFKPQALYFRGEGGIGKTRLLKETASRAMQIPGVLTTELIDLYHFRYHQPMAMMLTVAQQLEDRLKAKGDARPIFANFYQAIDTYLANSGVEIDKFAVNGGSVAIEVEVRKELTRIFLEDYGKLAANFGIVLLLDTFEKLHPIIEETNEFNFRQASHFEDWLVTDFIPKLHNTLTVLAGRENHRQSQVLDGCHVPIEFVEVHPLDKDETIAFIQASLKDYQHEIEPDLIEQLFSYSHGKPVVLSLALAYLQIEDEVGLPPLRAGYEVDEDFLIREIIRSLQLKKPKIANSLSRAFLLRKGLNIDLLMQIDNEPNREEVRKRIDLHARLPFFKRTGQRKAEELVVVLHDELYHRFYGRLSPSDARNVYDQAITYIEGLIKERLTQLEQGEGNEQNWLRAVAAGAVGEEAAGKSTRLQAAQEIRLMRVEQLFYELARNPKRGYQQYRRLSNAAIQAHDGDFDTLLQDELAGFFERTPGIEQGWGQTYRDELAQLGVRWDQVVFEEGVRWVERRLNAYKEGEDRYTKALEIADNVQRSYPRVYDDTTNPLPGYALDAARLRANMYRSQQAVGGQGIPEQFREVARKLEQLIQGLEAEVPADGAADGSLHDDDLVIRDAEIRYAKLVLAALYNDFGYYERMQERYKSAAHKYIRAIRLYNEFGPEANGLRAVVLTNLAFARHQQGFSKRGLGLVTAALELATKYGSPHQIATTYNMLARIELRLNRISDEKAYATVQKARTLFDTLKSGRGSALCALTEGNVLCARAASHVKDSNHSVYDRENTRTDYERAIRRYQYAMDKFDEQPHHNDHQPQSELLRRIEARVGLSAVYRERGLLQRQSAVTFDDIDPSIDPDTDLGMALELSEEALELCNGEVPKVTKIAILEDMAFVYIEQDNFEAARQKLQDARELIPADYDIKENVGILYTLEMEEYWIYWFRLGQLEFQEAFIAFRQNDLEAGCEHLLRSFACLHTFSPYTPLRHAIRKRGKRELQRAVERVCASEQCRDRYGVLRRATYRTATKLYIPEAIILELDELFDELEGLISDEPQFV